ncbi:MobF family relaxase [Kribbella sp. NPDC023855]|uniref:MobF family relaxase n=1 Tax=Kribbella sp. NPDC023855 TaxID=3154698 RepID=UPI0033EFEEEB
MAVMGMQSGHSASYLTGSVATGRENYYTGAVAAGEPPGRWFGRGAATFGLAGEVDAEDMTALYERFLDPRDPAFHDPARRIEAATLGHTGRAYKTEHEALAAALAKEPGASPERRQELQAQAGASVRRNVAFYDATFSPQKSITVLHTAFEAQEVEALGAAAAARGALVQARRTGDRTAVHRYVGAVRTAQREAVQWGQRRQAVEDAIWAGNNAALSYLQDKAGYTRVGHHGGAAGRWAEAPDLTIASFFQHDSREHDPQLHIHNAILNRVQGPDGKWRTLDGQALHRFKPAAAAVGERVMEQHLTRALGVQFVMRPDGKSREIAGVDQAVMDLFSKRRRAITKKTAPLVAAFEKKWGREPNNLELDRIQEQATKATRKAKSHDGETYEARLQRWDAELRAELRGGLGKVAADVLAVRQRRWLPGRVNKTKVLELALAEVQSKHATWRAADLTRAINDALPDNLGNMRPDKIARLLDKLTERGLAMAQQVDTKNRGQAGALPEQLVRSDGLSAYEAPGAARYVTPDHLRAERTLANAGYARGAVAMTTGATEEFVQQLAAAGMELGADQAAAVRGILSSGAKVETLVGPAGTGKSRVVGALAKAWEDPELWDGKQRRMVGLAASQVATEVLAADGVTAMNITRWLQTQQALTSETTARPEHEVWRLREGDLVVVDESAMANTTDLAEIQARCDQAGAKLLLVGDHRQLAAVGAGGGMELVTENALTHELVETRRFAAGWEGPASLRLRECDAAALMEYHKQGRIIDGGHIESAQRSAGDAWLADHLAGLHALLIVDTNVQAAEVSAQLRARLVELNKVDDRRTVDLHSTGNRVGAGDLIQTRLNAWHLKGYRGNTRAVFNRDEFLVDCVLDDGSLRVLPLQSGTRNPAPTGSIVLPAAYVRDHVALGYAATVHSSQGVTVDSAHVVATQNTSVYALYVGLTRGRAANTAHVVTRSLAAESEFGETNDAAQRSPLSVLRATFELDDPQMSALQAAAESATEAHRLRTPAELLADGIALATANRTGRWLDVLTGTGVLSEAQRCALATEDGAGTLANLLRQVELAGHDPRQVLTEAIEQRSLDDARKVSYVIQDRIKRVAQRDGGLDPIGDTYTDRLPQVDDPQWAAYLADLAREADARTADLGEQVAADQPQWALESLGELPTEPGEDRDAWVQRAGQVAAHREVMGHDAADDPLGPAPKAGQVEQYASWRTAWRALGRPDADHAEASMSVGQLRVRVRAYQREQAWAPPFVAHELAGTRQAAERERRTATLRAAEADTAPDEAARQRLLTEAEQRQALAVALDARAAQLQISDDARAVWLSHTAATQAAAQRAEQELKARGIDNSDTGPTVEEWADELDAAEAVDDLHVVDELDLADVAEARARDFAVAQPGDEFVEAELVDDTERSHTPTGVASSDTEEDADYIDAEVLDADTIDDEYADTEPVHEHPDASSGELVFVDEYVEAELVPDQHADTTADDEDDSEYIDAEVVADDNTALGDDDETRDAAEEHEQAREMQAPTDIREVAATEPTVAESDTPRVPSADETSEAARRAKRALIEIQHRSATDQEHDPEHAARDDELARWHADDQAARKAARQAQHDADLALTRYDN